MTDYTKLVEALWCCIQNPPETCVGCTYNIGNNECNVKRMIVDAATAIEALQAEVKRLELDNEDFEHEHRRLKGEIEALQTQLPKRGEWIKHPEVKNIYGGECIECPFCGEKYVVQYIADEKFCRNCGADMRAKMEVQE